MRKKPAVPPLVLRIRALVRAGVREIPSDWRAEAERLGFNARELHSAFWNNDGERVKAILAGIAKREAAAEERVIDEIDAGILESFSGARVEVMGLRADDVAEWMGEHPRRAPEPGEVQLWKVAKQAEQDANDEAYYLREEASAAARMNRKKLPPAPNREEIESKFAEWFRKNWNDRASWPTVDELRMALAMSGALIRRAATAGRWGERHVWHGGAAGLRSGRPPARVSPAGLAKVLLIFAHRNPCFSAMSEAMARHLDKS